MVNALVLVQELFLEICDARVRDGTAVNAGLERHTCERCIAAIAAAAGDTYALRIDDSLCRQVAHAIGEVSLDPSSPWLLCGLQETLGQQRVGICRTKYRITLLRQRLRPPVIYALVVESPIVGARGSAFRQHD